MVSQRVSTKKEQESSKGKPAVTPEDREDEMILLAINEAEKQIKSGNASSQIISHFLKLGTTRERLEQQRLRKENELLDKKIQALASAERVELMYGEALNAMRRYSGQSPIDLEEDFDEFYD